MPSETYYSTPVPGHVSVLDFTTFYEDKSTWFERELAQKNIYKQK